MKSAIENLGRAIRRTVAKYRLLKLYRKHGFPVTEALQSLVQTWSEVTSMQTGNSKSAQKEFARAILEQPSGDSPHMDFFSVPDICLGAESSTYRIVSMFLGSQVIPIGCGAGVDLLLTADDRLIGFADYLILSWSGPEAQWRRGLSAFLDGAKPVELGNAIPESQLESLEKLYKSDVREEE